MCAIVAFLLDQFSKRLVHTRPATSLPTGRFVRIREVHSQVAAFRCAIPRLGLTLLWLFALLSIWWLRRNGLVFRDNLTTVALGTALGGAAGNLADMLRRRHVVDFIDLGWWPVFNLADVAIVGGLLLAFLTATRNI